MARFTFEYEAVLRQRERAEREQQAVLARLERTRLDLENEIRGQQASIGRERTELASILGPASDEGAGGAVDLRGARLQANASLHAVARAQRAAISLSGVLKKIRAERAELARLAAARRAMETLRDRRYGAWKRAEAKAEDGALDEIAVIGHARAIEAARSDEARSDDARSDETGSVSLEVEIGLPGAAGDRMV